jgi:hypothetical protein
LGAVALGFGTLASDIGPELPLAVQFGSLFLLVHSLRWQDAAHPGAATVRCLAAVFWAAHSMFWTHSGAALEVSVVSVGASFLLSLWLARWWVGGERGPWVILAAALIALSSPPFHWARRTAPEGLLVMGASFVLFAVGSVLAWTRPRWETSAAPLAEVEGDDAERGPVDPPNGVPPAP